MRPAIFLASIIFALTTSLATAAPIKFAVILAKTGEAAISNAVSFSTVQFAIDEINAHGGLLGQRVEMLALDNKSSAVGSMLMAKEAIRQGAVCVIGPSWSSHAIAAAKILQDAKIPMMATSATAKAVTEVGDYIFRACFTDDFQGHALANFALQDLRATRGAVLVNISNAYSVGLYNEFRKNFTAQGGKIVFSADYLSDRRDFKPLLEQVKTSDADFIFIPGYPRDAGLALAQGREMGLPLTFLGGDSWGPMHKLPLHWDSRTSAYFVTHWHYDYPAPANQHFMENFPKTINDFDHVKLNAGNVLAYDAANLFADAIKRANSLDTEKIRNALRETKNFAGATGNITFNKEGTPSKDAFVLEIQKENPKFVKVIPARSIKSESTP